MATTKKPDGDPMATVAALRERITATQQELTAVERRPRPLAEAEQVLADGLDRLASLYDPDPVLHACTSPGGIDLATVRLLLPDPAAEPQRFAAFVVAVFGDLLLESWLPRLRLQYDRDPALGAAAVPAPERPARLAALRATLSDLELAEERAILRAERLGIRVDRRHDADPAVIFAAEVLAEEEAHDQPPP